MEGGVELVVCNVRFDDSRMFDFLGALNAMPGARRVPVVCCARGPWHCRLPRHARAALREAVTAHLRKGGA